MAVLEILGSALTIEIQAECVRLAVAGPSHGAALVRGNATRPIPTFVSVAARRGDVFCLPRPSGGAVAYLAIEGGFKVEARLGSFSTYRRAGLGGFEGRSLMAGDFLPLALNAAPEHESVMLEVTLAAPRILRAMRGPNVDFFPEAAFDTFFTSAYAVSPVSDRMGLRLEGDSLKRFGSSEMLPQGTTAGAVQVPPDGRPVLLLADRPTTGGYPRIATVIGADIPAAGRLTPGMTVRFQEVSFAEAVAALQMQQAWLASLPMRLTTYSPDLFASEGLLAMNLVDGVTTGLT
jgi:biotin-dependent carboxylase-like uncharacterized protein